jgi:hypothetical protein
MSRPRTFGKVCGDTARSSSGCWPPDVVLRLDGTTYLRQHGDACRGGVNVGMIGTILLIVGIVGLVISIVLLTMRRRTDVVVRDDRDPYSRTYVEPRVERRTYVEPPPDRGSRL